MDLMCDKFNQYISLTANRDKVMAIVQFLPLALSEPAAHAGCPALGKSLLNLSNMADGYRAVNLFNVLLGAFSKTKLDALCHRSGDELVDLLDRVSHVFLVLLGVFGSTAALSSRGLYGPQLTRLGGCAVTCWFYTLCLGIARELYILARKSTTAEDKKRNTINLTKLVCFFFFAMSCVPAGGPKLLESASGPLAPVHYALRFIAPKHLPLSATARGTLGLIASVCDFY